MTEKYTPIPLRKIDGDVDVGRNVAIGGDAIVQGKSHYKGDVRIDGWLDAENIKGPNKGLFTTLESLKRAYPHPKDGWWAIVSKTLPGPIYVGDKGQWIRAGGETSTDVRLVSVDKTRRADEAEHAKTADVANYANEAGKLSDDSDLINRFVSKEHDDTVKGVITFLKGIIAKAVSYFQGIVNRGDINNNGDITNTGNISNKGDITNTGEIVTRNLRVTGKATFFELEILKAKAAGGIIIQSAATFKVDDCVETTDEYVCYQQAEKDGKVLIQMCEIGDQMLCHGGLNVDVGVSHNVSNHYYWRLVTDAPEEPVERGGKKYLKIVLSKTEFADGSDKPQVGDELAQVGNRVDKERQSVIMTCAYKGLDNELKTPYWVQYTGVNDYKLATHKCTWFAANGSQVTGNFKVQSDNGGLESIEDYVKGLATNTVVYKMSISPSLYYINSDGTAAAQVVNISAYKIQGDKMTQLQDSDDVQVYVSIGVYGKADHGKLTGSGGSWRYFPSAKDGMEERILELSVGGKIVDRQVVNAVKDGEKGKDAVSYKLLPMQEAAVAYKAESGKSLVRLFLAYKIQKTVGEVTQELALGEEGIKLSVTGITASFESKVGAYVLDKKDVEYKETNIDTYIVTLTKGGNIVDKRIVPITFKPKVVFDIDTENGEIRRDITNVKGDMNSFKATTKETSNTVGNLKEQYSQLKLKSDEISLTVNNGTRPNLLWGSDLDLSGVQDVMKSAYAQGDTIKMETEAKAEWKRSRDNADSDDDRMRYQEGMDVCDRKIAQAQGEVAKCREAIQKHLGVVISGDIEIGNREMFQYLKGEGVGGSDAIRFKNTYKRENWAKWTHISWKDVPLKPHTIYTISVWVKFKSYGKKGRMYIDCASDDGRYCFGGYLYKENYYSRESIDEWQRVRYVFDSGASKKMSALNFCCIADEEGGAQCEIWLCRPKLEEGNTATPWCAYDGTVEALLESGLDIKNRKMIATADNFVVQNNKGEKTFMVDENGRINNGLLNTLWFYRSFTEIKDSNFREYMTYVNGVFRPEIRGSYAFYWVNVAKTGPSITFNITSKSRHENTNFYPAPRIYLNYLSYMPKRNMVPGVLDNLLLLGSEMVIVNKGDIAVGVVGSLCFSGYGFPSLAYHGNGYDSDEKEERRHYYQPLMISIDKGEVAHLRCRLIGDRTNVKIGWEYAVGKVSRWNDAISYHPYYQPSNLTDMADGNYPVNDHGEEFTE